MRPALGLPFHVIRVQANAAIREARALRQSPESHAMDGAAVNWADLRVIHVEHWEDDGGRVGWRVVIAEASPTAVDFAVFVREYLRARGLPDVDVVTEW